MSVYTGKKKEKYFKRLSAVVFPSMLSVKKKTFCVCFSSMLTLSVLKSNTDTFANSVDPDEIAHNQVKIENYYNNVNFITFVKKKKKKNVR